MNIHECCAVSKKLGVSPSLMYQRGLRRQKPKSRK